MNSLLDGYNEKTTYTENKSVESSLLDGYAEPTKIIPTNNEPQAGLIPMAQRIGTGAIQGIKNIPNALVDFANQSVQAGKQEFQKGYNPIEAVEAGTLGAIQGAGNLLEGVWNLPGDLINTYYGKEKIKPTQPLTQGIPNIIGKTEYGKNYLSGVQNLQEKYPLTNLLTQEIGEEIPAIIAGATLAKYGVKAGKLAKTADKISDVGYGKLAGSSALSGLGEGFIVDPAQGQNLTPNERLAGRFTNAYSGAVIAPTLNVGMKAGVDIAPKVADVGSRVLSNGVDAVKSVSAQIIKSFEDTINTPTSFDKLREINKTVGDKVSPTVISNARIRDLNNDLRNYANLLDAMQSGEFYGQRLDDTQLKAVKRHLYKLEDSFKSQNDFINQNINKLDLDTLAEVQSNLQGRYQGTQVKDGYNVYGVPVSKSEIDKFNQKYDSFNTQQMLNRIAEEQRARLEKYKQKLIDEGKIKNPIIDEVPDSLLDGYNETAGDNIPKVENEGIKNDTGVSPENVVYDSPDGLTLEEWLSKPRRFKAPEREMTLDEWRAKNGYPTVLDEGLDWVRNPKGDTSTDLSFKKAKLKERKKSFDESLEKYKQLKEKGQIPKVSEEIYYRADGNDTDVTIAKATVFYKRGTKTSDNIENLDIKKTSYTTKHGQTKEIEYVETPPKGWVENKGATTAPNGYTWYHNGESITSGKRKSVLVKDGQNIDSIKTSETPKVAEETSNAHKYKYDIGKMEIKNALKKYQRDYIAKTIFDEYKGDLYLGVKKEDIFDVEKNPKVSEDKNIKPDEMINLFIPDANAVFTIPKNPYAIRRLFEKLGIKLQENIDGIEKYTNKSNPTLGKFDLKVFDGDYISDGVIAVRPEYVNIKDESLIKKILNKEITANYQGKISKLFPEKVEQLTDTNNFGTIPAQTWNEELKKWESSPNKRIKIRIFENKDGQKVYIDEKYSKIFDSYRLYQGDKVLGPIVAKNKNGENIGLIMPYQIKDDAKVTDIMPYKKQSVFDKKVYKNVAIEEPAVTNIGKHKYDKTQKKALSTPRIVLQTETQAISKIKNKLKFQKAKDLKDAKAYNILLKDGIRQWDSQIRTRQYDVGKNLTEFINKTKNIGKKWGVDSEKLREIMPFLRERTGIPENLNRPDLKNLYRSLTDIQKRKLTDMADEISSKFEQYWEEYQSTHADETNEGTKEQIENYITHIWDLDKKQKSLMTNYFATRSRFAKERTIKTLFDGIQGIKLENGEVLKLQPKVLDYAEILQVQADNLIKTTFDKLLADEVKGFKTVDGISLVMPASKAPSDWVTFNHPALNKTIVRPIDSKVGEVITPKLQNILAEMGVAIGRRLNPGSTLGVYRRKMMRPEISLQRWFSNKTLAHEIGHAIDYNLGLRKDGFVNRHKQELLELNEERINILKQHGKGSYARSDAELVAEFFGFFFNDPKLTQEIAPNATLEIIEKLSKNDTLKKLLPDNFDWENAKHAMEESTVEMFKTAVKVHPDIADTLSLVFENISEPNILKTYDKVNNLQKQLELGFSGFHIVALSEGMLGNLGIKETLKILNPKTAYDAIKNGNYEIYKNDTIAKQAITDGLQIGSTIDLERSAIEKLVDDVDFKLKKVNPLFKWLSTPARLLGKGQKLNNKVLWDYLHNTYKIRCYEVMCNQRAENKGSPLSKAERQEIASFINDSFGGQIWEHLHAKKSTVKWGARLLLSVDWQVSTAREFLGMFATKKGHQIMNNLAYKSEFFQKVKNFSQQLGIISLTDDINASGLRGKIARGYFGRAVLYLGILYNIMNATFREKDRQDHPDLYPKKMNLIDYSILKNSKGHEMAIFIGRNKDGRELYLDLGKKLREVPEFVENPLKKAGGKLSPMVQVTSQSLTGHTASGFKNRDFFNDRYYKGDGQGSIKHGWERVGVSGKTFGKSFIPFTFSNSDDFNAFKLFAPTSTGMSNFKGKEYIKEAIRKGDIDTIKLIDEQLKRNNIDSKKVTKEVISELKSEIKTELKEKLKEKAKRSKK